MFHNHYIQMPSEWSWLTHCGHVKPYGDIDQGQHYLNQYWLITNEDLWHSSEGIFIGNDQDIFPWHEFKYYSFKITATSRGTNELMISHHWFRQWLVILSMRPWSKSLMTNTTSIWTNTDIGVVSLLLWEFRLGLKWLFQFKQNRTEKNFYCHSIR